MSGTPCEPPPVRVIAPADAALTAVADAILRRRPSPGQPAPTETELTDELRISRRSARRALDALGAAGILSDASPGPDGSAPRVLRTTPADGIGRLLRLALLGSDSDRDEIVGARTAIERGSAYAAAAAIGEADLHDLRALVGRMREPSLPASAFAELDTAFHLRVAQAAGGLRASLLHGLADSVITEMRHAFARITDWPATARRLADEHDHLATLVGARQGAEAAEFVTRHVTDFYRCGRADLIRKGQRANAI